MTRVNELLETSGAVHFISILDLMKGYWKVTMDLKNQAKTACVT